MSTPPKQILFFDGVCNLCNGFVDFIITRDRRQLFAFAPLQGAAAKRHLPSDRVSELDTVVLYRSGELLTKSDAALAVLTQLGGFWGGLGIFWCMPKFARDKIYDFVAKYRYVWFGRRESCRLPSAEERARFLD